MACLLELVVGLSGGEFKWFGVRDGVRFDRT